MDGLCRKRHERLTFLPVPIVRRQTFDFKVHPQRLIDHEQEDGKKEVTMHSVMKAVLTGLAVFAAGVFGMYVKAQTSGTAFSVDWVMNVGAGLIVGFISYYWYSRQK